MDLFGWFLEVAALCVGSALDPDRPISQALSIGCLVMLVAGAALIVILVALRQIH